MASALPKLQLKFSWKEPLLSCGGEGAWARKVVEPVRKRDAPHARSRNEESGKQLKRKKTEENDTYAGRFLEKMEETLIEDSKVVGETPITKCLESVEESALEFQRSKDKYEDIIAEEGDCVDVSFKSAIDGIRVFLGALESEKKEISTRILDLNVSATEALSDVLDTIAVERDNFSIQESHAPIAANHSPLIDDQMLLTQ